MQMLQHWYIMTDEIQGNTWCNYLLIMTANVSYIHTFCNDLQSPFHPLHDQNIKINSENTKCRQIKNFQAPCNITRSNKLQSFWSLFHFEFTFLYDCSWYYPCDIALLGTNPLNFLWGGVEGLMEGEMIKIGNRGVQCHLFEVLADNPHTFNTTCQNRTVWHRATKYTLRRKLKNGNWHTKRKGHPIREHGANEECKEGT